MLGKHPGTEPHLQPFLLSFLSLISGWKYLVSTSAAGLALEAFTEEAGNT